MRFCGGNFEDLTDVLGGHSDDVLGRDATGHGQFGSLFVIDAELLTKGMGGATDLVAELFLFGLILADLDVPAHQAGGKAGVLTLAADRLAEVLLGNGDMNTFFGFVDLDVDEFGGFEGFADQLGGIFAPADDVDLFVVEFANDVFDARSTHAHTGTDGVDLWVDTPDSHLGAESGFTGDAAQLHRVVGNLVDLGFEQTTHEVRMTAGKNDFRAAAFVLHSEHVAADTVTNVVVFALDALAVGHDAFKFAEVNHHIITLEAADGARNDVTGAVLEFLVDHLLLGLTQTLHHGLLGCLYGDAAEVLGSDVEFDGFVDLDLGLLLLSGAQRHFVEFIAVVFVGDNV